MDIPELLPLLDALAFSADRHRHQRRKGGSASPYINHPIEVARIITAEAHVTAVPVLMAAILHDTIEDTATSHAELVERFGPEVADMVLEVSDDPALPKAEQRRRQETTAADLSYGARLIRIADKLSNIRDLLTDPPPTWSPGLKRDYLVWTRRVVDRCRGTNEALEHAYDTAFAQVSEGLRDDQRRD